MAPTPYLTEPELQAHLPGDLTSRSTVAQRQAALDRACSEADGYMRAGEYVVPVAAGDITEAMVGAVADMARYHLAVVLRLVPEPASSSSLYIDYQAARAWWDEVATNRLPQDAALVDATGGSPGEAVIYTRTGRGWGDGW